MLGHTATDWQSKNFLASSSLTPNHRSFLLAIQSKLETPGHQGMDEEDSKSVCQVNMCPRSVRTMAPTDKTSYLLLSIGETQER